MQLVLLSDTHTMHGQVSVPDGDVLIHAGDMALDGRLSEVQDTLNWLNNQSHQYVVAIGGNHDWALARPRHRGDIDFGRVIYLENNDVDIEGIKFWGSPVTPTFFNWAFNVDRGAPIRKYWNEIPEDVDVLITHGPPFGALDQVCPNGDPYMVDVEHLGCEELRMRVDSLQRNEMVHIFGHIHGGYGSRVEGRHRFYNASVVNEAYKVVNAPWVVEID